VAAGAHDLVRVKALRTVKVGGAYRKPGEVVELARSEVEELIGEGAVALLPSPPVPSLAETGYKGFKPLAPKRKKKR